MARKGGILLYLRQEGRGIGLYNKIDTNVFQRKGMNTCEANKRLGFGEDERDFSVAQDILEALGVDQIQLIIINPKKIRAIDTSSINLIGIVNTGIYKKEDNANYLNTKLVYGRHKIEL